MQDYKAHMSPKGTECNILKLRVKGISMKSLLVNRKTLFRYPSFTWYFILSHVFVTLRFLLRDEISTSKNSNE
jgi:hypothetical protein